MVTLYNEKRPWIEVPKWLPGDIQILLTVRQLATQEKDRITAALLDACEALDEYVRSL